MSSNHLITSGVSVVTDRVPITAEAIAEQATGKKDPESAALQMRHMVRRSIDINFNRNPAFYKGLRERLDDIIKRREARALTAQQELDALAAIATEVQDLPNKAKALGLSDEEYVVYGALEGAANGEAAPLAKDLNARLLEFQGIRDARTNPAAERTLRGNLKRRLMPVVGDDYRLEQVVSDLVAIAKTRLDA